MTFKNITVGSYWLMPRKNLVYKAIEREDNPYNEKERWSLLNLQNGLSYLFSEPDFSYYELEEILPEDVPLAVLGGTP